MVQKDSLEKILTNLFHESGWRNIPDTIRVIQEIAIIGMTAGGNIKQYVD